MKEFKGTPGPWVFDEDSGLLVANDAEKAIAEIIFTNDTSGYEDTFNSALIAASPAMLSALQHLIEVYDDPTGKQWTTTSKREALDKAREAINLAMGE